MPRPSRRKQISQRKGRILSDAEVDEINTGMREISDEGHGVMMLEMVFRDDVLAMARAARRGDTEAKRLLDTANQILAGIEGKGNLCLFCDAVSTFTTAAAITWLGGAVTKQTVSMAAMICVACVKRAASKRALLDLTRDKFTIEFDGLRAIEVHREAGHA